MKNIFFSHSQGLQESKNWVQQRYEAAANPLMRKLYGDFGVFLDLSNTEPYSKNTIHRISSVINTGEKHFDSLDDDAKHVVRFVLEYLFLPSAGEVALSKKLQTNYLWKNIKDQQKHLPLDLYLTLFKAIHLFGKDQDFEDAIADEHVTFRIRQSYRNWKVRNGDYINDCAKRYIPEPLSQVKASPASSAAVGDKKGYDSIGVTYIDVHYPLVHHDEPDDMGMPTVMEAHAEPEDDTLEVNRKYQGRTDTLVDVLLGDHVSPGTITVRRDKSPVTKRTSMPYNLIDIHDGQSRARIAVCDWNGFATFVIRDPAPLKERETLYTSNLRDDPKVWSVKYANKEQWIAQIQKLVYAPVEQLDQQLKHRCFWNNRKAQLIETFTDHIMNTGQLPCCGDMTPIRHGPLKDRTTFSRAYGALQSEHIAGLEGIRTFRQLYRTLMETRPELADFLDKPPLLASVVFNACSGFTREYGLAPQKAFYDAFEIDGRKPASVSEAFRRGVVQGVEDYLPAEASMPETLEDFIVSSGLAERQDNGELIPAARMQKVQKLTITA